MTDVATPPVATDRVPLYEGTMHRLIRFMFLPIIGAWAVGFASAAFAFLTKEGKQEDLIGLALAPLFWLFARSVLRTQPIYGSPHGLEYKHKGTWRTVPWTGVRVAQFAPWSWGFLVR
ncbi:MAG: hypothetical protein ABW133_23755, partial [Polyangiaceae bacterium]